MSEHPEGFEAAGATADELVEFIGEHFTIADRVGLMPLLRFAHAAKGGSDTADVTGMAALYEMLRDCIQADDWARFEDHATANKADGDDLLGVVQKVMAVITARPTQPRSDSSSTPPTSGTRSKAAALSVPDSDSAQEDNGSGLVSVDELLSQLG